MSKLWGAIVGYFQSTDPGVVRAIIFKLVRWALTAAGGILESKGYLDKSQTEQVLAAVPMAAALTFSIFDTYVVKAKITNAGIVGQAEMGGVKKKDVAVAALKETTQ